MITEREVVAVHCEPAGYPDRPPFHPEARYPELPYPETGSQRNPAYAAVREAFRIGGLDAAAFGTRAWNPLGAFLEPGQTVLLKPNLVNHRHPRDPEGWRYMVTHGSVVRAVADYVWKALDGRGTVVVADAPETYASFPEILRVTGLDAVGAFYRARGLDFQIADLRREEWTERDGVVVRRRPLPGDPRGAIAFDLGDASEFTGHPGAGRYYGADYDTAEVNRHHSGGRHEYRIAASAIEADVVISVPKLKTHRKAGITVSLKNLVGINADKNWLPHHTEGQPANGGDEHPDPDLRHRLERTLLPLVRWASLRIPAAGPWLHRHARAAGARIFGDTELVVRGGNWWGNDTIWRMCLDLNKILLYGNRDGSLRPPRPEHRKRHLVVVDGILAGEGRGPVNPDPVPAGLLLFGIHPASTDAAAACLMGFDPEKIPIVRQAFRCQRYALADWTWQEVRIRAKRSDWNRTLAELLDDPPFRFQPHYGWRGHIESPAATAPAPAAARAERAGRPPAPARNEAAP